MSTFIKDASDSHLGLVPLDPSKADMDYQFWMSLLVSHCAANSRHVPSSILQHLMSKEKIPPPTDNYEIPSGPLSISSVNNIAKLIAINSSFDKTRNDYQEFLQQVVHPGLEASFRMRILNEQRYQISVSKGDVQGCLDIIRDMFEKSTASSSPISKLIATIIELVKKMENKDSDFDTFNTNAQLFRSLLTSMIVGTCKIINTSRCTLKGNLPNISIEKLTAELQNNPTFLRMTTQIMTLSLSPENNDLKIEVLEALDSDPTSATYIQAPKTPTDLLNLQKKKENINASVHGMTIKGDVAKKVQNNKSKQSEAASNNITINAVVKKESGNHLKNNRIGESPKFSSGISDGIKSGASKSKRKKGSKGNNPNGAPTGPKKHCQVHGTGSHNWAECRSNPVNGGDGGNQNKDKNKRGADSIDNSDGGGRGRQKKGKAGVVRVLTSNHKVMSVKERPPGSIPKHLILDTGSNARGVITSDIYGVDVADKSTIDVSTANGNASLECTTSCPITGSQVFVGKNVLDSHYALVGPISLQQKWNVEAVKITKVNTPHGQRSVIGSITYCRAGPTSTKSVNESPKVITFQRVTGGKDSGLLIYHTLPSQQEETKLNCANAVVDMIDSEPSSN